ncbi:hypothetical protein HPB50_003905 [Hyalomma asiaticum]|uniref:Uncharacterized protein n=1 Tax=Hyalomma asiaticum TaxID=266040 RepID=A0ACB7T8J6_HYAAI|nr:hypothetical protein HPB50_003905 [Hyalomma asiaticum]
MRAVGSTWTTRSSRPAGFSCRDSSAYRSDLAFSRDDGQACVELWSNSELSSAVAPRASCTEVEQHRVPESGRTASVALVRCQVQRLALPHGSSSRLRSNTPGDVSPARARVQ